jgi:hypothetical protein
MKPDAPAPGSRGPTSSAITFSKDIPLKRDSAEAAPADSGMAVQVFFVFVVAIAALALYWFSKRRHTPASEATAASRSMRALGLRFSMPSPVGAREGPQVMHRCRLDRQQCLYVIEWHGAQHLVVMHPSGAAVVASHSSALNEARVRRDPGGSAP